MKNTSLCLILLSCVLSACGEDTTQNFGAPILGPQIDRNGRAAISTALIETFSADTREKNRQKDIYNAAPQSSWTMFRDQMKQSLAILDSLDTICGNQLIADANASERYGALADVLLDDQLYVDSSRSQCGIYLGLEAEIVGLLNSGEGLCGGRMPDDDVTDINYSALATGQFSGVVDGVNANDRPNSPSFPFLAPPNN